MNQLLALVQLHEVIVKMADREEQLHGYHERRYQTRHSELGVEVVLLEVEGGDHSPEDEAVDELDRDHYSVPEQVRQPEAEQGEEVDNHEGHRVRVDELLRVLHVRHALVHIRLHEPPHPAHLLGHLFCQLCAPDTAACTRALVVEELDARDQVLDVVVVVVVAVLYLACQRALVFHVREVVQIDVNVHLDLVVSLLG